MDKVFIEGLEIDALIGIYDWERRIRQTLVFDIEMGFDNRIPAAITSEMSLAVRLAEPQGTEITLHAPSFLRILPKGER